MVLCICQDIPALYLQGGSIIPVGPAIQHVGEANPTDDLSLLVALDEHGNFSAVRCRMIRLKLIIKLQNCLIAKQICKIGNGGGFMLAFYKRNWNQMVGW